MQSFCIVWTGRSAKDWLRRIRWLKLINFMPITEIHLIPYLTCSECLFIDPLICYNETFANRLQYHIYITNDYDIRHTGYLYLYILSRNIQILWRFKCLDDKEFLKYVLKLFLNWSTTCDCIVIRSIKSYYSAGKNEIDHYQSRLKFYYSVLIENLSNVHSYVTLTK